MTAGACEADAELTPQDVVDYELDPSDDHLAIIGTAGKKVTTIGGLEKLDLRILVLRSHLIRKMEGLAEQVNLETLELYDNAVDGLEDAESMARFTKLQVLDISFNSIRDMAPVAPLTTLTELYIANNKITSLGGLGNLKALKTLDVGANRLRSMEGLQGLDNIEHLWMGKNKITSISCLEGLTKIRRLDVQSNRLTRVENLSGQQENLEELYLGSNGIDDAGVAEPETGLARLTFPKLNVLDMSKNKLTQLSHFKNLSALDELWLSENLVGSFDEVVTLAGVELETIYLEHNPVSKDPEYRKRIKELLPTLTQIDANAIGYEGRGWGGGGVGGNGVAGYGMGAMTDAQRLVMMQKLQQATIDRAKAQREAGGA
jgi:protein phosphatase 1 regulatory subunit 7